MTIDNELKPQGLRKDTGIYSRAAVGVYSRLPEVDVQLAVCDGNRPGLLEHLVEGGRGCRIVPESKGNRFGAIDGVTRCIGQPTLITDDAVWTGTGDGERGD